MAKDPQANLFEGKNDMQNRKKLVIFRDGIFETGAYRVPSKSQNPTVLDCGLSSTQYSNLSWACHWHHLFGTNNYPPFEQTIVLKTNYSFPHWIFFIFCKN